MALDDGGSSRDLDELFKLLPQDFIVNLRKDGWFSSSRLAALRTFDTDERAAWWGDLAGGEPFNDEAEDLLEKIVHEAGQIRLRRLSVLGKRSFSETLLEHGGRLRDIGVPAIGSVLVKRPAEGTLKVGSWRVGSRRALDPDAGPKARELAEARDRRRQVEKLVEVIMVAELPALVASKEALDPSARLMRCGRGRRATTIRQRVREWLRFRQWLASAHGVMHPVCAQQVRDYVEVRLAEPCTRGVILEFQKALNFIEMAGEVREVDRLSRDPGLLNFFEEVAMEAAVLTGPRLRRKAHLMPVSLLIALELAVLDSSRPPFDRALAWYRLVKVWTSCRYDDTRGISPASMRLDHRGFFAMIERTKTTGAGKKIEVLEIHVSWGAFLVNCQWLKVGFDIWKGMNTERDYLLALPNEDRTDIVQKPARWAEAQALSQALFTTLALPVQTQVERLDDDDDGFVLEGAWKWDQGDSTLFIAAPAVSLWTEHSDRSVLKTWVTMLGGSSDLTKRLGRWQPESSEEYIRSTRRMIEMAQTKVASRMRASPGMPDIADEESVMEALRKRMELHGTTEDIIVSQLGLLRLFQPTAGWQVSPKVVAVEDQPEHLEGGNTPGGESKDLDEDMEFFGENLMKEIQGADDIEEDEVEGDSGPPEAKGYVVSIAGGRRRLHFRGKCFRQPGIHYQNWKWFGSLLPATADYTDVCKSCWPDGEVVGRTDEVEEEGSEVDSMEESSSSSDGQEVRQLETPL